MPNVNPEILLWARKTANLTPEQAVGKLQIRDARGVSAVQRLLAYETGQVAPTRSLLVRMAKHYRRPLLTFFLSAPPRSRERGVDFRVLSGSFPGTEWAFVDALLRDVRTRQSMIRAVLEDEEEAQALPIVGSATVADGKAAVLEKLQHCSVWTDRTIALSAMLMLHFACYARTPKPRGSSSCSRATWTPPSMYRCIEGSS